MISKNIFLIDGASGTGKSDFVEYVKSSNNNSGIIIKTTTRIVRNYEKNNLENLDLKFCSKEIFDSLNLEYKYEIKNNGEIYYYGFSKKDLEINFNRYNNIFIIVRCIDLMRKLKKEYNLHKLITVYVHSDISKIEERLKKQELSDDQIKYRIKRIEATYKDYVLNSTFFDEVIVNNSDIKAYHSLIDSMIQKYISK